jgi:DNA-binding MarR family transcriptional regulator
MRLILPDPEPPIPAEAVAASATLTTLEVLRFAEEVIGALELHAQGRYRISAGRLALLQLLDGAPGRALRPAELAERLGVTRATATGLLDALEADGLVARRRDPRDGRGVRVALTAAGRERMGRILPGHTGRLAAVTRSLTTDERSQLVALLDKVRSGLRALRGA